MKTARRSDELTALQMFVTCKLKGVFSAADVKSEHGEWKYSENTLGKVFFATAGCISRMNNIKHAV